jgi:glycosyltransferase involved in cell wall biosynthesis
MKLSIVIPTRGDQNMRNIIECLHRQTFTDFEVIFVLDTQIVDSNGRESHDQMRYITNLTHTILYHNASALRNLGIKEAKGEFIQLMDDDEWFDEDYLQRSLDLRTKYRELVGKDFVLTPTLMYRKTGHIQNQ